MVELSCIQIFNKKYMKIHNQDKNAIYEQKFLACQTENILFFSIFKYIKIKKINFNFNDIHIGHTNVTMNKAPFLKIKNSYICFFRYNFLGE